MNIEERMAITQAFFDNVCTPILRKKGAASGTGSDANKSFRDAAAPEYNHDHYRAWWGGFYKQVDRLKRWVFSREETAEPLDQMLADVVNYALIGVSMMVEDGILQFEGNPYGHESPEEETERQGLETWWDSGGAAWRMQTFRAMRRGDDTLKVYSESQILPVFEDLDVVIKEALDKYYTKLPSRPMSEAFGFAYQETPLVSPPPGKIEGSLSMSKDGVEGTGCFRPGPASVVAPNESQPKPVEDTVALDVFAGLYYEPCKTDKDDCKICTPCRTRALVALLSSESNQTLTMPEPVLKGTDDQPPMSMDDVPSSFFRNDQPPGQVLSPKSPEVSGCTEARLLHKLRLIYPDVFRHLAGTSCTSVGMFEPRCGQCLSCQAIMMKEEDDKVESGGPTFGVLPTEISKFVNLYLSCCEQKSPDSVADCGTCLPCRARVMAYGAVKEESDDKTDSGGEEGSSKCSGGCA